MIYKLIRIIGFTEDGQPIESKSPDFINLSVLLNIGTYSIRNCKLYRIAEFVRD